MKRDIHMTRDASDALARGKRRGFSSGARCALNKSNVTSDLKKKMF